MSVLDDWSTAACDALGLTELSASDRQAILDLARDAAHGVVRPAAPLTTFLLGVVVGRGADLAAAAEVLTRLAEQWPERSGASADNGSDVAENSR